MKEFCKNAAAYVCRRRIWTPILIGLTVCFAGIYVLGVLRAPVNHDEVEHLHVAFKILNGSVPYRDFYQNHWPIHWLLCITVLRISIP